eukprot:CAMPEP_0198504972 /NCGR_PEP_ID=MMETSP1462-20131121/10767_1 /TAXON_ID=1333877 /ORGANISM="Brandtodinium nutriculum, Strain RCC3387" /LENGTH=765 /DNA_ID=CAMNT_0044234145 /DNA_START=65 /DNA_END=2362 /DNA_ORIENTATION=+
MTTNPLVTELGASVCDDPSVPLVKRSNSRAPRPMWRKGVDIGVLVLMLLWLVTAVVHERQHVFQGVEVDGAVQQCERACQDTKVVCAEQSVTTWDHLGRIEDTTAAEDLKRDPFLFVRADPASGWVAHLVSVDSELDKQGGHRRFRVAGGGKSPFTQEVDLQEVRRLEPTPEACWRLSSSFEDGQKCIRQNAALADCGRNFDDCMTGARGCGSLREKVEQHKSYRYVFIIGGLIFLRLAYVSAVEICYEGSERSSHTWPRPPWLDAVVAWILPVVAALGFVAAVIARLAGAPPSQRGAVAMEICQASLGVVCFPLAWYALSANRSAIQWRVVACGFAMEVLVALCMRFDAAKYFVKVLGQLFADFIGFASHGAEFVFNKELVHTVPFAFSVMPAVVFFSACVALLYYWGCLQNVIMLVARTIRSVMGCTLLEAVNSSGNIFLSMTEVPLMLKPVLPLATEGELFAILVGGFASVAGSVLAGYISMGIKADYLLLSCFMSAPTGIALSRIACPDAQAASVEQAAEAEAAKDPEAAPASPAAPEAAPVADYAVIRRRRSSVISAEAADADAEVERRILEALVSKDASSVEAIARGAVSTVALVANMMVCLIAFVALVSAVNGICTWLFARVGANEWFRQHFGFKTFGLDELFGIIASPVAFLTGVPWSECMAIGEVLSTRLFLNEFVAYGKLGKMTTLSPEGMRTASFALCGFASLGSVGIMIGAMSAICPERQSQYMPMVVKSMLVGYTVGLMNACFATILIPPMV